MQIHTREVRISQGGQNGKSQNIDFSLEKSKFDLT